MPKAFLAVGLIAVGASALLAFTENARANDTRAEVNRRIEAHAKASKIYDLLTTLKDDREWRVTFVEYRGGTAIGPDLMGGQACAALAHSRDFAFCYNVKTGAYLSHDDADFFMENNPA